MSEPPLSAPPSQAGAPTGSTPDGLPPAEPVGGASRDPASRASGDPDGRAAGPSHVPAPGDRDDVASSRGQGDAAGSPGRSDAPGQAVPPARDWTAYVSDLVTGVRASVSVADLLVAIELCLVIAATGLLTGLIWTGIAPHGQAEMTAYGAVRALPYGETAFAAEAVFGCIGLVAGALVGVGAHRIPPASRRRGPVLLLGVTLGSLGAAWLASRAGAAIGHETYDRLLRTAALGQRFTMPVSLTASGLLLVQPLVAAAAYTLSAAWSPDPQLDSGSAGRPERPVSSATSEPVAPPAAPEPPAVGTASSPPA